jgi:hypothetical protein
MIFAYFSVLYARYPVTPVTQIYICPTESLLEKYTVWRKQHGMSEGCYLVSVSVGASSACTAEV